MTNGRDCPHGRQVGKCDTCDLIEAEKEIDALKSQVEQLQQELSAEQEMVSNYHDTNSALAAQVEQLRKPLSSLVKVCHDRGGSLQQDGQFAYKVKEHIFKAAKAALDLAPAQCLAEIKAQAVEDALALYTHKWSKDEEINKINISILRESSGLIFPDGLKEYANQLRQQAKVGDL